jgi:hypothetical protein
MRVYIAGGMSGYPEHNFPAFFHAAEALRALGHEPVNPAELDGPDFDHDNPQPWEHYLKRDIVLLLECDAVFTLEGWAQSKGATLERHIAKELGMPVFHRLSDVEEGVAHDGR